MTVADDGVCSCPASFNVAGVARCQTASSSCPSSRGFRRATQLRAELARAIPRHRATLVAQPESVLARTRLAKALTATGAPEEAVGEWREVLQLDPEFHPALAGLGEALEVSGNVAAALVRFEDALRIDGLYAAAIKGARRCKTKMRLIEAERSGAWAPPPLAPPGLE